MIDFYKYNYQEKAISDLESVLLKVAQQSLIYLKVLNTLSNFYLLIGRDEDYEKNHSLLTELYQTKDLDHQEILFGYIRVRYNYAYYITNKRQVQGSYSRST